nr:uncharacterized protein LOC127328916 [Lolium perenne]
MPYNYVTCRNETNPTGPTGPEPNELPTHFSPIPQKKNPHFSLASHRRRSCQRATFPHLLRAAGTHCAAFPHLVRAAGTHCAAFCAPLGATAPPNLPSTRRRRPPHRPPPPSARRRGPPHCPTHLLRVAEGHRAALPTFYVPPETTASPTPTFCAPPEATRSPSPTFCASPGATAPPSPLFASRRRTTASPTPTFCAPPEATRSPSPSFCAAPGATALPSTPYTRHRRPHQVDSKHADPNLPARQTWTPHRDSSHRAIVPGLSCLDHAPPVFLVSVTDLRRELPLEVRGEPPVD